MPTPRFDLTKQYAIEQGVRYDLTLFYPGDLTAGTVRGQIQDRYDRTVLADWSVGELVYEVAKQRTKIPLFLTAVQAAAIPCTQSTQWAYAIEVEMSIGAEPIRLLRGSVEVTLEIAIVGPVLSLLS